MNNTTALGGCGKKRGNPDEGVAWEADVGFPRKKTITTAGHVGSAQYTLGTGVFLLKHHDFQVKGDTEIQSHCGLLLCRRGQGGPGQEIEPGAG